MDTDCSVWCVVRVDCFAFVCYRTSEIRGGIGSVGKLSWWNSSRPTQLWIQRPIFTMCRLTLTISISRRAWTTWPARASEWPSVIKHIATHVLCLAFILQLHNFNLYQPVSKIKVHKHIRLDRRLDWTGPVLSMGATLLPYISELCHICANVGAGLLVTGCDSQSSDTCWFWIWMSHQDAIKYSCSLVR